MGKARGTDVGWYNVRPGEDIADLKLKEVNMGKRVKIECQDHRYVVTLRRLRWENEEFEHRHGCPACAP